MTNTVANKMLAVCLHVIFINLFYLLKNRNCKLLYAYSFFGGGGGGGMSIARVHCTGMLCYCWELPAPIMHRLVLSCRIICHNVLLQLYYVVSAHSIKEVTHWLIKQQG